MPRVESWAGLERIYLCVNLSRAGAAHIFPREQLVNKSYDTLTDLDGLGGPAALYARSDYQWSTADDDQ